jgi:uncharacterized protein DUF4440
MVRSVAGLALFAAVAITSSCTLWSDKPARTFSQTTGGENLERVFWRQVKAKNWKEVGYSLASNFVAVTPTGQLDRAAALERLKELELKEYSLGDFRSELNGNTFVVTYTLTLRGKRNGEPLPEAPQRMMAVWQQQQKGWVEIAHSTLGPEEK